MLARPEQTEARVDSQAERLERRFSDLVDTCSRFSREIVRDVGWNGGSAAVFDPSAANAEISRTVFGKWSLDILTLLYMRQSAGFQEIRRGLGRVSSRVLSSKLAQMQETGHIMRAVKQTRQPRVSSSLKDDGREGGELREGVTQSMYVT